MSRRHEQASDEARFRELFETHYRAIARYLGSRHPEGEVDDLVAATFEVAWRRLDAVPEGEEAVPWLFTVARNHSRNAWRRTRRDAAFVAELTTMAPPHDEMAIEEREQLTETMQALSQLKAQDRDLILLVTWDELSPTDAGRVLGLRPHAARSRLHRARQRLAAQLQRQGSRGSLAGPTNAQDRQPDEAGA